MGNIETVRAKALCKTAPACDLPPAAEGQQHQLRKPFRRVNIDSR
jgi:hypothetical protein